MTTTTKLTETLLAPGLFKVVIATYATDDDQWFILGNNTTLDWDAEHDEWTSYPKTCRILNTLLGDE